MLAVLKSVTVILSPILKKKIPYYPIINNLTKHWFEKSCPIFVFVDYSSINNLKEWFYWEFILKESFLIFFFFCYHSSEIISLSGSPFFLCDQHNLTTWSTSFSFLQPISRHHKDVQILTLEDSEDQVIQRGETFRREGGAEILQLDQQISQVSARLKY